MTLTELIEHLQEMEDDCGDHVVLMASDPEGNSFAGVSQNFLSIGVAEKVGCFYEYHEQEDDEDPPAGDPCICLWP